MPLAVRWFIRTAMLYLILGFALGAVMLIGKVAGWPTLALLAVHTHLLTVGFFTMMVFGVSFWLFPPDLAKRFSQGLAQWTYVLLNGGLILRLVFELIFVQHQDALAGWLMSIGGLMQVAAVFLFVINMRGRVRGRLSELRKEADAHPPRVA